MSNVEALSAVLGLLPDAAPTGVALASMLAAELDRQAGGDGGVNAALVREYVECLRGLTDGEAETETPDVLSVLRDAKAAGAA